MKEQIIEWEKAILLVADIKGCYLTRQIVATGNYSKGYKDG